jgi:mannitol-specific phosphotransferase system IIBC component
VAETVKAEDVKKIVFVCEAGMGSSLIGTNQLKRKLKAAGLKVKVVHAAVHAIPDDADIVIAHAGLANRAREAAQHAVVIGFQNFVNNPVYDEIATKLKEGKEISAR